MALFFKDETSKILLIQIVQRSVNTDIHRKFSIADI